MDLNQRKPSFRFKFLKELDYILSVPKLFQEGRNEKARAPSHLPPPPPLSSRKVSGAHPNSIQAQLMSALAQTKSNLTAIRPTSVFPYTKVTSSPSSAQAAKSSRPTSQIPTETSPRRNEELRAQPAPFSLPPREVVEGGGRPTRVAERAKSIKRPPPLHTRSVSTFYINLGNDVARPPTPPMKMRNHVVRSASVDDVFDFTNQGSETHDQSLTQHESFRWNCIRSPHRRHDAHSQLSNTISTPRNQSLRNHENPNMAQSPIPTAPFFDFSNSSFEVESPTASDSPSQLQLNEALKAAHVSEGGRTKQRPTQSFRQRVVSNWFSMMSLDTLLNHGFQRRESPVRAQSPRRFSDTRVPTKTPNVTQSHSVENLALPCVPSANGTVHMSPRNGASSIHTVVSYENTLDGLKLREKVIWFTEKDIPEIGIIKWLGKINEKHVAGVEFNNHVGNCDGKWNGRRLFFAAATRGRFVPINELILYSDFTSGISSNTPANIELPFWEKMKSEKRASSIVCVICQDPLVMGEGEDDVEEGESPTDQEMVTTPCGHLFHHACLNTWFNVKRFPIQACPYCQRTMDTSNVIRVFPVQLK